MGSLKGFSLRQALIPSTHINTDTFMVLTVKDYAKSCRVKYQMFYGKNKVKHNLTIGNVKNVSRQRTTELLKTSPLCTLPERNHDVD